MANTESMIFLKVLTHCEQGHQNGNVYHWNLEKETSRLIAKLNKGIQTFAVAKNNPNVIVCHGYDGKDLQTTTTELRVVDIRTGNSYPITTHGTRISSVAIDPSGTILVTRDIDGVVRVGPITGEEPHLLFGHEGVVLSVAIHPQMTWIASSEITRPVVKLWPMPKGKPLHTLPSDQLLKKPRSLTNVRVVADEKSSTGYQIHFDPFPGWKNAPKW